MKKYGYLLLLFALVGCSSQGDDGDESSDLVSLAHLYDEQLRPFYHGVASGDPGTNSVVIWTRVTPDRPQSNLLLTWQVSNYWNFGHIVAAGSIETSPDRDYTAKVEVDGLEPDSIYFYRFEYRGGFSSTGRTKTLPVGGVDSVKFVVVSCSNYEAGFFNAYGRIAEMRDIDAVIHLGDYIYEYAPGVYGDSSTGRFHEPPHEIITLDDYRTRYSQYRLDKDLQAAHRQHPFITIWDDHEIANNSYVDGAQNHQENEGDYEVRKNAAKKAYYEWLPVMDADRLFRKFQFGDLINLFMLDERIEGRTAPVPSLDSPELEDSTRSMLGKEQLTWLTSEFDNSDVRWDVIGNQVIFSYLNWGFERYKINLDSWDGYPFERKQIITQLLQSKIINTIFITGDTHSSWAFEVTDDPFGSYMATGGLAFEFGAPSINSANSNERMPTDSVRVHEKKILGADLNPHLKYTNMREHGFLELTIYPERARARWYYVQTVREPNEGVRLGKELWITRGSSLLEERGRGL